MNKVINLHATENSLWGQNFWLVQPASKDVSRIFSVPHFFSRSNHLIPHREPVWYVGTHTIWELNIPKILLHILRSVLSFLYIIVLTFKVVRKGYYLPFVAKKTGLTTQQGDGRTSIRIPVFLELPPPLDIKVCDHSKIKNLLYLDAMHVCMAAPQTHAHSHWYTIIKKW